MSSTYTPKPTSTQTDRHLWDDILHIFTQQDDHWHAHTHKQSVLYWLLLFALVSELRSLWLDWRKGERACVCAFVFNYKLRVIKKDRQRQSSMKCISETGQYHLAKMHLCLTANMFMCVCVCPLKAWHKYTGLFANHRSVFYADYSSSSTLSSLSTRTLSTTTSKCCNIH